MSDRIKLTDDVKRQFELIADYYDWLTFEPDIAASCPSWNIFDGEEEVGTIFYFGSWRIESSEDQWGEDFDVFVEDIPDFYQE